MSIIPIRTTQLYHPGETVAIYCSADVGSPHADVPWSWQWRDAHGASGWTPYPFMDRVNTVAKPSEGPGNKWQTTLKHFVAEEDGDKTLRCLVNNDEKYSAPYTINVKRK